MKLCLRAILILYIGVDFGFSQLLDYDLGLITKKTKINITPKAISKKYKVKLAVGDTVKVLREENKKYFKITFNDKTGWVNKKRVRLLPKKKITAKPKVDILEHTKKLQSRFKEEKLSKRNSTKKKKIENRTNYQKNTYSRDKKNKVDKEKARKIVINILYGILLVGCAFSIYLFLKKLVMSVISSLKRYKPNSIFGSIFEFIGYLLGLIISTISELTNVVKKSSLNNNDRVVSDYKSIENAKNTIWYLSIVLVLLFMPRSGYRLEHFIVSGIFTFLLIKKDFPKAYIPKNKNNIGWLVFIVVIIFGSWFPDIDILLFGIGGHRSPLTHSALPFLLFKYIIDNYNYGDKEWNVSLSKVFAYSLAFHLFLDILQGGDVRYVPFDNLFLLLNGFLCIKISNKYFDSKLLK